MMIQSSSSTRSAGSTKSDMKTWCPITTRPLSWQRSLKTSTLTIPRRQNAHADALASLAASLALPVGAAEKVFIYSHDLYCCKFTLEDSKAPRGDLQVKEVLKTSTSLEPRDWRFSYIDFVLYGILPDDPKEAVAIRRKAP